MFSVHTCSHKKYGPVVLIFALHKAVVSMTDPAIIKVSFLIKLSAGIHNNVSSIRALMRGKHQACDFMGSILGLKRAILGLSRDLFFPQH